NLSELHCLTIPLTVRTFPSRMNSTAFLKIIFSTSVFKEGISQYSVNCRTCKYCFNFVSPSISAVMLDNCPVYTQSTTNATLSGVSKCVDSIFRTPVLDSFHVFEPVSAWKYCEKDARIVR